MYTETPNYPAYIVVEEGIPVFAYASFFANKPTGISFPHVKITDPTLLRALYDDSVHLMERAKAS